MKLEESTISHLVVSENVQKAYEQGLRSEHFEGENKNIFEFIVDYWSKSGRDKAPTAEVIHHKYASYKHAESEETLDWLISELKKRYKFNQILKTVEKVADLSDKGQVDEALHALANDSFDIMLTTSDRKSLADFVGNTDDRIARYVERSTFCGEVKGCSLGLLEVDQHTFGLLAGELGVLAGYSGTGKTWALLKAALESLRNGISVYFVTLELSREEVEDRLDAMIANVSHERITRGSLTREELDRLSAAQAEVSAFSAHLFVDHVGRNERTVQALVNNAKHHGAQYLIIDQLSFLQGRREYYKTPQDKITEVMNDLKESISDTSERMLSCLIAVQFNRDQKKSGKVALWNLAEAAVIERVADMVFGLNQSSEMRANKAMLYAQLKFRRGPLKNWMLNWDLGDNLNISVDQEVDEDGL